MSNSDIKLSTFKCAAEVLPAMRFTVDKVLRDKKASELRNQITGLTHVVLCYHEEESEEEVKEAKAKLQGIIDLLVITE